MAVNRVKIFSLTCGKMSEQPHEPCLDYRNSLWHKYSFCFKKLKVQGNAYK